MRYSLLLLFFISAWPIFVQSQPGWIARWKMDNNCKLSDVMTELPSDGVLVDVSLAENKDNVANSALSFHSNTSFITLGVVDKLKLTGDKTISFWINPVLSGSNRTGSVFSFGTGMIIRYEEQGSVTRLNIIFGNISYMQVSVLQDQWQFVTIAFKKDFNATKSKVYCYVDGVPVAESEQNKTVHDFNNSIALIGPANQNILTNGFRGRLDELSIYNRTLTSAEILDLVLPVKLEFFRGKNVGGVIELNWKTQLEENVSHFNLYKSLDGVNFQKIGRMEAGKYNYLIYDFERMPFSTAWYRLQIVDIDWKTTFSNIIKVAPDDLIEPNESLIKLFPNPSSNYINFVGISGNVMISIINNSGVIVKRKQFSGRNAVDISDLDRGLYYIVLFDGKRKTTVKFIKR